MVPFTPAAFESKAFNCPWCGAFARQNWIDFYLHTSPLREFPALKVAYCTHCSNYTLWHQKELSYPDASGVRPPNPDLSEQVQHDYLEAAGILSKSPRGAAALLRLCVQKLCIQLGEKGENPNDDISSLVRKGLPAKVQQALDIVRVVGNNSVHPGQMDLKDDQETASKLFELVNLIAEVMISQPKEVEKIYTSLPDSSRKAIEGRDKPRTP